MKAINCSQTENSDQISQTPEISLRDDQSQHQNIENIDSQNGIDNYRDPATNTNEPTRPKEEGPKPDTLIENINHLEKLLNTTDEITSSTPHIKRSTHGVPPKNPLPASTEMIRKIKDLEDKYQCAQNELEEKDLMIETLQMDIQYKNINYRELEENYSIIEERLVTAIEELKISDHKIAEISKEPKKIDVALLGKKHPKDLIRNFINYTMPNIKFLKNKNYNWIKLKNLSENWQKIRVCWKKR